MRCTFLTVFLMVAAPIPSFAAEPRLKPNELSLKNATIESFTLWVWCFKHGRRGVTKDWDTYAIKKNSTFRHQFSHNGKFRLVLQMNDKKFRELGHINLVGRPLDKVIHRIAACKPCKEWEEYRCRHCGKIHRRYIGGKGKITSEYIMSDRKLKPIPER